MEMRPALFKRIGISPTAASEEVPSRGQHERREPRWRGEGREIPYRRDEEDEFGLKELDGDLRWSRSRGIAKMFVNARPARDRTKRTLGRRPPADSSF